MLKTLILGLRIYFRKTHTENRYYSTFITNKMQIKYCKVSILQNFCIHLGFACQIYYKYSAIIVPFIFTGKAIETIARVR